MMFNSSWSKVLGGFLLGTVGVSVLKSKAAEKVYTYATAGVFIAKDRVLEGAEYVQSKAMNVADDAKVIVEKYYADKDAAFEEAAAGTDCDEDFTEEKEAEGEE